VQDDFFPLFGDLLWNGSVNPGAFWQFNFPSGLKQTTTSQEDYVVNRTDIFAGWFGACLFLRTGKPGRRGTARIHWPYVHGDDMDGELWNTDLANRLSPLADIWINGFSIGGVTFTPVVWSRKDAAYHPIEAVDLLLKPMVLRKRRRPARSVRLPIPWPLIW
jgi:hypothetical protein